MRNATGDLGHNSTFEPNSLEIERAYHELDVNPNTMDAKGDLLSRERIFPLSENRKLVLENETIANRSLTSLQTLENNPGMKTAHFARVGGGCVWALQNDMKLGQVEYHFCTNRRILLGRVEMGVEPRQERKKVLTFILSAVAELFPGFVIYTLVEHLQNPGASSVPMWGALHNVVLQYNMTVGYESPRFTKGCSNDMQNGLIGTSLLKRLSINGVHHILDSWGVITLVPRARIKDWESFWWKDQFFCNGRLGNGLQEWSADVRIREADAQGGGILYADLREKNNIIREVGRLIFHDRDAPDGPVRIAFLHVKSQFRRKKVASSLLDHLHRCLFPGRTLQVNRDKSILAR